MFHLPLWNADGSPNRILLFREARTEPIEDHPWSAVTYRAYFIR